MKSFVQSCKKLKAFTLVELLVVISIIALLVSIVLPAISGALFKGKMTAALANGRGIQQSIFAKDTESVYTTTSAAWPQAEGNDGADWADSSEYLFSLVSNGTLNVGLNYFTGPGIGTAIDEADFKDNTDINNIWAIAQDVGDSTSETLPVIFTRNFDIASFGTEATVYAENADGTPDNLKSNRNPFQDKGFVFITKSGAGYSLFKADLTVGDGTTPGPFRTLFNILDFAGDTPEDGEAGFIILPPAANTSDD